LIGRSGIVPVCYELTSVGPNKGGGSSTGRISSENSGTQRPFIGEEAIIEREVKNVILPKRSKREGERKHTLIVVIADARNLYNHVRKPLPPLKVQRNPDFTVLFLTGGEVTEIGDRGGGSGRRGRGDRGRGKGEGGGKRRGRQRGVPAGPIGAGLHFGEGEKERGAREG